MRYAVQLIAPAGELAMMDGWDEIRKDDAERARELLLAWRTLWKFLKEYEEKIGL